jgi:uncharacterized iron-regulated membrane protein
MFDKLAYWYRVVREMLKIVYSVSPGGVILGAILILIILGLIVGLIIYLKRRRARAKV